MTAVPIIAGFGTSIAEGTGNGAGNDPYWALACMDANMPHIRLAKGGSRAQLLGQTIHHRMRYALAASATDCFCEHAVNDLGSSGANTFATVAGSLRTVHSQLQALGGGGKRVWQFTVPPSYNSSTDGWLTLANQTPSLNNPVRIQINAWIRAGCPEKAGVPVAPGTTGAVASPYLFGYFEIADLLESSRDSGLWKADGTSGGVITVEGVHPNTLGHQTAKAGVDLTRVQAAFDAATGGGAPPPSPLRNLQKLGSSLVHL